jgi:hypothetical protein
MFTILAGALIGLLGWWVNRDIAKDRPMYDGERDNGHGLWLLVLHVRQDLVFQVGDVEAAEKDVWLVESRDLVFDRSSEC